MNTIRWNLAVSPDVDKSVRMFLAEQGGGRKGDLSRLVVEAVQDYLFDRTLKQIKAANAHLSEDEVSAMVDEALDWARKN